MYGFHVLAFEAKVIRHCRDDHAPTKQMLLSGTVRRIAERNQVPYSEVARHFPTLNTHRR